MVDSVMTLYYYGVLFWMQIAGIIAIVLGWRLLGRGAVYRVIWVVGIWLVLLGGVVSYLTGFEAFVALLVLGIAAAIFGKGTARRLGVWTTLAAIVGCVGADPSDSYFRGWYAIPSTQDARLYGRWISFGPVAENPPKLSAEVFRQIEFAPDHYCFWHGNAGSRWGTSGNELDTYGSHTDDPHIDRYQYMLTKTPHGLVLEINGSRRPLGLTYKRVGDARRW